MEMRLEKPAHNNFKDYGWQKWKPTRGILKLKTSVGNLSMESKVIEFGKILKGRADRSNNL